jgi:hypothetical protein
MAPKTAIQKNFRPLKNLLPSWLASPIRSLATAVLTPVLFSLGSGHFRSSFKKAAVSRKGDPIPWYTYPCIEFLRHRSYRNKVIVEFGGGQSTLWWASKARHVVTFEGDKGWYDELNRTMPPNVDLFLVSMDNRQTCIAEIEETLSSSCFGRFDVIIIDGLYREQLMDTARQLMTPESVIICDDSEGYGFYEGFKGSGLNRVDFFGYKPGVVLPNCTSIFFGNHSFLFESGHRIPDIAKTATGL